MDSVAFCFVRLPSSNVGVSLNAFPETVPHLLALTELALIGLSVGPVVDSLAVCFSIHVESLEGVPRGKVLEARAMPLVAVPVAFVDSAVVVHHHSFAMSLECGVVDLSSEYGVFIPFDSKAFRFSNMLIVELLRDHVVVLDCITEVLID